MDYTLSMFFNHTYPDTYKTQVQNDMEALIEKYTINVNFEKARKLKSAFDKFLELLGGMESKNKQDIIGVVRYLVLMANHSSDKDKGIASIDEELIPRENVEFDWHAYLNQGIEIANVEESDESDWSEESKCEEISDKSESQIFTEDDSKNDVLTSVEICDAQQTPTKEGNNTEDLNEAWKAGQAGYKFSKIKANRNFPAPFLAELCSGDASLRIISEYSVIREIIMALRDTSACGLIFKKEALWKYSVCGDVTVCSLSPEMFRSVLGSVTPALCMLGKMHNFVDKMLPSALHSEFQYPPKTYQSYAAGLQLVFDRQNNFLLDLENEVKKQDDIFTINTCLDRLQPFFRFLYEVYKVHELAVFEKYDVQQYWICSTKLLSVLWSEAEQALSLEISSVLISLLLITLKPYLDITENWFMFGSIDDPYEEYFISGEAAEAENTLDGDYVLHPFEQSLLDLGVTPMPLLKIIAKTGLTVGRSICLLRGLDHMDQIPKSSERSSIYKELVEILKAELIPSKTNDKTLIPDTKFGSENQASEKILPDSLEQYTLDYILSTSDANVLEAFGDVLNLGLESNYQQEEFDYYERLEFPIGSEDLCSIQSLNHILCDAVQHILDSRVHDLGRLAQDLLRNKCKISDHLSAMQKVAFFEVFSMQEFCTFLVEETAKDDNWLSWANWVLLTNKLQVCLSDLHLDWSHLFSIQVATDYTANAISEITEGFPLMQLINRLSLNYLMKWPTNLVLTEANMQLYNNVFRFFLKIKCALSSLQRICLDETSPVMSGNVDLSHRLWILRSWLLFLLRTIHDHILSHILLDLKQNLDQRLCSANSFHSALEAHERFVKHSHYSCLLSKTHSSAQEHIMEVVAQAMVICDAFQNGSIEQQCVENMELKLNLAFNFLTIFYDSVATSSSSVHLMGLSVALNEKAPNF
ncbi:gamma-tubulin complex component 5-like isoform X2 [Neocloeon triangulifer]|nr:gamma-tubulin complex component 5-like isoform X2 [Neocloeon triangulifer]